jgi:Ca2+/H+ antiporter
MRAPNSSESSTPPPPNNTSTVILLLSDIANTTWRMFAPTLILTGLGLWIDTNWHTIPLWSLIGVVTGVIIAALLIRQQFKNISKKS